MTQYILQSFGYSLIMKRSSSTDDSSCIYDDISSTAGLSEKAAKVWEAIIYRYEQKNVLSQPSATQMSNQGDKQILIKFNLCPQNHHCTLLQIIIGNSIFKNNFLCLKKNIASATHNQNIYNRTIRQIAPNVPDYHNQKFSIHRSMTNNTSQVNSHMYFITKYINIWTCIMYKVCA